jgi:DNA-binding PadR family transcriptional regulator
MTNAELVLLSLIAETPRHGYELEKVIDERGMRNWTDIAFSSIYFLLNKLVKEGLISATIQPAAGRGPAKKVYSVMPRGVYALREGVRSSLANPFPGDRAFLLGLSCLPLLSQKDALSALRERQNILQARREELAQHPALSQPDFPDHVKAMFTYSLVGLDAELDWLGSFIEHFEKG